MDFDCIVVGGGPAGLTAAVYLGRFRRRVLVIDSGNSRALSIPTSHNYPGFADGISGTELVGVLRRQAEQYGAELSQGLVSSLVRDGDRFCAVVNGRALHAPRILIASGLKDRAPDMPGLREAVAHAAVRYCPVCDAYEARGKSIAVYGPVETATAKAEFMRTYSRTVTVLPLETEIAADARRKLTQAGITLAPSAPADFRPVDEGIDVALGNGDELYFDVLYPVLGCEVRSDLALALGARCNDVGCLAVDDKQQTSIEGVYAAGDVVSDLHQLTVAAGHAAIAATAIHRTLPTNFA
jgi:thioredoxin reductase (NADPH)